MRNFGEKGSYHSEIIKFNFIYWQEYKIISEPHFFVSQIVFRENSVEQNSRN